MNHFPTLLSIDLLPYIAGVIGIEVTILSKLLSYDSPSELLEDVKETVQGVSEVGPARYDKVTETT